MSSEFFSDDVEPTKLFSYRHRGEQVEQLPGEFRQRFFYKILDSFKWYARHREGSGALWEAVSEVSGVEWQKEAGARNLWASIARLRGLPRSRELDLHHPLLEAYLLQQPTPYVLGVLDVLIATWWRSEETVNEVNALLEELELPFKATQGGIQRTEPALERRTAKRQAVLAERLPSFCPPAADELNEAEKVLQIGENENDWSRVGHQCRVALQDFAQAAYAKWCPNDEPMPKAQTKNKLRAVLDVLRPQVSNSSLALVLSLVESVPPLIEKAEHRSEEDGTPVSESDAEQAYLFTSLLMERLLALANGGEVADA